MSWHDDWLALRERIRSLVAAGDVYARFIGVESSDSYGGSKELRRQASDVYDLVDDFYKAHSAHLPVLASTALKNWLERHRSFFESLPPNADWAQAQGMLTAMLPFLAALESELTYHLADRQQQLRLRSERAFAHLQRLIAADPETQKRWKEAFDKGEPACEKLGAAHLLLHGIWAFKAKAEKAITDLVFQEPLSDLDEVARAAAGLVLTEWKKAEPGNLEKRFEEARDQAKLYAAGALGGIELRDHRYAVVVTKDLVKDLPDDLQVNGVRWRHINIAVDPKTPSKV